MLKRAMVRTERTIQHQTGFSATQRHVVASLYRQPLLTASHIADQLNMSRGAATQLIDALEKQGVVERVTDSADRRVVRLQLTDTRRRTEQEFQAAIAAALHDFFSPLTDDELAEYARLMDKLATAKEDS